MPIPDFFGPNLKVERAKHHIGQLEMIFANHMSRNMERLRPKKNSRGLNRARDASLATFPKHTPTVLGDAIHNLRAALDHAYCIMVEANRSQITRDTYFPFRKDETALKASINGHKLKGLTPSDAVIATIVDVIQPYEGGKFGLYGLHLLDITDKHLVMIPMAQEMRLGKGLTIHTPGRGDIRFVGLTLRVDDSEKGSGREFIQVADGGRAVLHDNPKSAFHIVFQQGQPFEGESILSCLKRLQTNVVEALNLIRNAA
jgi:hypothetical protein